MSMESMGHSRMRCERERNGKLPKSAAIVEQQTTVHLKKEK